MMNNSIIVSIVVLFAIGCQLEVAVANSCAYVSEDMGPEPSLSLDEVNKCIKEMEDKLNSLEIPETIEKQAQQVSEYYKKPFLELDGIDKIKSKIMEENNQEECRAFIEKSAEVLKGTECKQSIDLGLEEHVQALMSNKKVDKILGIRGICDVVLHGSDTRDSDSDPDSDSDSDFDDDDILFEGLD